LGKNTFIIPYFQVFKNICIVFTIISPTNNKLSKKTKETILVQKEKQRSTEHTHKTKDRVTQTPLKTGDEFSCLARENFRSHGATPVFVLLYISESK
jgi:hypothetical protein